MVYLNLRLYTLVPPEKSRRRHPGRYADRTGSPPGPANSGEKHRS